MTQSIPAAAESILNTLLEVGDVIFEVSEELIITAVWYNRQYSSYRPADKCIGKKIGDLSADEALSGSMAHIRACFEKKKSYYFEQEQQNGSFISVRILPIHPDKKYVFVVVEHLSEKEGFLLGEDKWKLALDAAGDGVWDFNLETGAMFFSDKWHEMFGYGPNEINTQAGWSQKLHPDDLAASEKAAADCMSGITDMYSAEIRYLCKDGSYKWILSRGVIITRNSDGKALRMIGTHTNINERKVAEEKHQDTARLLATFIDNIRSAILVADEHGRVVFANQNFCDIYDIESPARMVGENIYEGMEGRKVYFKEEDRFVECTRKMMREKKIVINEEWELKSGKVLSRDYVPISLDARTIGGIWQLRDVTAQKKAEQQLQEQRFFYESILNHIPADIGVFDPENVYLFVNKHSFKNEGLRQWLIGKTDVDFAKRNNRPESFYRDRYEMFKKAAEAKENVECIEHLPTRDGKTEHHLRVISPVFFDNGSLKYTVVYGINITELIEAQEALKTSMGTFSSAFEHSGIGMALISPFGHWLDVNKIIVSLTGYTKEELRQLTFHDITYPEDKDKDVDLLKQMLRKEISTYTIEKRYLSKEKKIIWVSLTLSMVWNDDDTPKFFIAQILDISQRKELENEVNKRNNELEATKISLINKVKQLEELSYIIAHNLRGAAGNIRVISGAMVAKYKGGEEAGKNPLSNAFTPEEAMGFIEESSISLMGTLSTLMKITEIKLNNKIPYNICDVRAIINDILGQLNNVIFEKKAVIELQIQFPHISYPKPYLENILYNLISNALKYSRADVPPQILVRTRMWNGKTQVTVKDNGLGIDMQKYGHLVFKLNNVFHKGFDSKGVGLYITKTQVESMGGTIEVTSNVNEGSEFIVTLGE